ncbi:MAG: GNAT family N-acetyltransferase [Methylobacterium sp.]|nr:GNAT family N-acetyltransferase [Methylobacterium sp.]
MSALLDDLFSIEQDFKPNGDNQMRGMRLLLDLPDRACLLVARDAAGQVAGLVSAQLVISTAEGAPSAWVEDMVVRADCRGQGLGRALLEALLEWAAGRGATRAQLLVDLDNKPALEYYRHLGWQTTRLAARRVSLQRGGC